MDNIELVPLELITSNRDAIRKVREAFLISKGKTLEPSGLHRRDEIWSVSFLVCFIFSSILINARVYNNKLFPDCLKDLRKRNSTIIDFGRQATAKALYTGRRIH